MCLFDHSPIDKILSITRRKFFRAAPRRRCFFFDSTRIDNSTPGLLCGKCASEFFYKIERIHHLMKGHNIKIDEIKLTFASIDQFNRWKNGEEKATKTYFSKTSSSNNIVYSCCSSNILFGLNLSWSHLVSSSHLVYCFFHLACNIYIVRAALVNRSYLEFFGHNPGFFAVFHLDLLNHVCVARRTSL